MIYPELLKNELEKNRDDFVRFAESQADELANYLSLLRKLEEKTSAEIRETVGNQEVGALTSNEFHDLKSATKSFEPRWKNHEEARKWAFEILENRTTFAADGSQIFFERETSIRVGAVQIGMFENSHTSAGSYKKQAKFELLTPQIFADAENEFEKPFNAETVVGMKRFFAEVEAAKEFMLRQKGWQVRGEKCPLAFFDGTLLISISLPRSSLQGCFIQKMVELVNVSRETEVPVVGYVDQSFARDLIGLLDATNEDLPHEKSRNLHDSELLNAEILKFWGDRTAFFYCRRKGLTDFFDDENGESKVGFVYLQTTGEDKPARLDIPAWIYEKGLLEEVLDTVRAECVVGLGYPYALETADSTAVISTSDRQIFLRALQEFAERENLNFKISRKAMSKTRRR